MLSIQGVTYRIAGRTILDNVSVNIPAGQKIGLVGPNGAGKSTMFNLISGVASLSSGDIRFHSGGRRHSITRLRSRQIAKLGMARSFQHVRLLPEMSVLENVAIGAHLRNNRSNLAGMVSACLRMNRQEEQSLLYEASKQLERVGLGHLQHVEAGSLALGQQRLMEIARALCCDPILLLLDEPAAGLRLQEKQALATLLLQLKNDGMSILLVEHDMDFVTTLADRLVVMEFGSKIAEGLPAEVQRNPVVLEAYLGGTEI